MDGQLLKKAIVEFIGTFSLLFMGIGAIVMTGGENLVAIAFAHGLAIGLLIMAAGHISGGFFNPAVTIGMLVTRRISGYNAGVYIVAQLLGAVAGTLFILAAFPESMRDAVNLGVPAVGTGYTTGNALIAEIVTTFFLIFVIFGVAVDQRSAKAVGGLAIGLTITMDIFATGAISGAAMNPARWFGPAIVGGHWDDFWIWIIGPIVGAVVAALIFNDVLLAGEGLEDERPSHLRNRRRVSR
ncbi:MAG TPA: MIP/aquaporin family protein [Thermomicrobiales bacterium]|jgi:aquaporin TIP|nr:MIP/aquaporin family protein [Thermomicrobiales bacterium]